MPRFICVVGKDPEVYVCDDESIVQGYMSDEWFICFDTQTGQWFLGDSGGEPREAKQLPELEKQSYYPDDDNGEEE